MLQGKNEPMVRVDVVAQKLADARKRLRTADEIFGWPVEDFLADEPARDLACFYLLLVVQDAIDIAAHWVEDADWGTPEDVGAAFDMLRDRGVIDPELARGMRAATGLRHRIDYGYGSLDPKRIWTEYRASNVGLRQFLATVAKEAGIGSSDS